MYHSLLLLWAQGSSRLCTFMALVAASRSSLLHSILKLSSPNPSLPFLVEVLASSISHSFICLSFLLQIVALWVSLLMLRYIPTGVHFHLFHHKEEDYGTCLPRRSRANAIEQHKTCFTQFKTSQPSSVAARTQAHTLSKTFSSSLFRLSPSSDPLQAHSLGDKRFVLAGTVLVYLSLSVSLS
ncbi:hypothetical protein F2Q68_00035908 [Brassica cretica]|uniref:Uncharacterized protein n=1 Tax=Brassica cretica TaxID=69181 RepID=A0A8S9HBQ2_BRACR|nr:hypothetical protein F2Q68_00035908 [Brassica cretica]